MSFGGNEVDFRAFRARSWNGEAQELTEKEAMILKVLAEHGGEIVSREDLLEKVWGYDVFPSTRTVDNFILQAAQALREGSGQPAPLPHRLGRRLPLPDGGRAMSAKPLRIGTRASALALWQAHHVEALLRAQPGAPAVELVHIKTEGDIHTEVPLWQVGGRAFFTKEIDRALLEGTVDLAVHSLKDLSTLLEPGLELAATLQREDPRDAFLSHDGGASRSCRRARASAPAACGAAHSSRASARTSSTWSCAATCRRASSACSAGDYDAIILAAAALRA